MLRITLLLGIATTVLLGISYLYYRDSQEKLADLNKKLGEQALQIESLNGAIQALTIDAANVKNNTEEFLNQTNDIRAKQREFELKLNKHDIGAIGGKHPLLLEHRVNKGTNDFLRGLEALSKPEPQP